MKPPAPISWSRGYARGQRETSGFYGHPTEEAAIEDARACLASRGVTEAWVAPVYPGWKLGEVTWRRTRAERST